MELLKVSVNDFMFSKTEGNKYERTMQDSTVQKNIYFENSFGKIYEDSVQFNENEHVIYIKEIAFLRVVSKIDTTSNSLVFFLGIVFLICGYEYYTFTIFFLLQIFLAFGCFVFWLMYKKVIFFLQVVFCRSEHITIRIKNEQTIAANELIKEISFYRKKTF